MLSSSMSSANPFRTIPCRFAVGVVSASREHVVLDRGPLPEAVAASAAIPLIFDKVDIPGMLATCIRSCNY